MFRSSVPHTRRRRRGLAVLLVFAVLAAACGDDDSADSGTSSSASSSASPSTSSSASADPSEMADDVTSNAEELPDIDENELPEEVQNIIALDEYAAMNLLALGITPSEVTGTYASLVSQAILADQGVAVVEQADAFSINLEAIAASAPDVIVATAESAFVAQMEPLEDIATTVILPYTEPWRDVVTDTGTLFERPDEAAAVVAALEAKMAETQAIVAENPFSLSVLGDTFGIVFAVSPDAVLSAIIDEAGIGRPQAQIDGESMVGVESVIAISTEILDEHDADIVAVMSGVYYTAATITDAPSFGDLAAVQGSNDVVVDGDMWFGTHPFAIFWILEDLQALALGEGAQGIGTMDDIDERWAAYLELVG